MKKVADCFVLVSNEKVISPPLITIRSYGEWFQQVFDEYTCHDELYLKAKKDDDTSVLEYHPGTKIGKWFDSKKDVISDPELKSWYIWKDSFMMDRLVNLSMAEYKDATNVPSVNERVQVLRVYTKPQLELYLKTLTLDKNYELPVDTPKQVRVKASEMIKIIKPEFNPIVKKKLF